MVSRAFHFDRIKKIAHRFVAILFCFAIIFAYVSYNSPSSAHFGCFSCNPRTCNDTRIIIETYHGSARPIIRDHITNRFIDYRRWLLETFFRDNLLQAMMRMTEQLSAVGMHQMFAVGALMDAKIQLDTQRDLQTLQVEAIKDYQPSEDFCTFGTNMRSVSASEHAAVSRKLTLNKISMTRHLGTLNSASAQNPDKDKRSRWDLFVAENCMVFNNNWDPNNPTISGLQPLCGASADSERANRDIHYGRFIDQARTINDVDFINAAASDTERDVISLARNLYGHDVFKRDIGFLTRDTVQSQYFDLRAVAAKRAVAENSFNSIVAMKTPGTTTGPSDTRQFMASILRDLGIDDINEITDLMGDDPSYYAQLEVLAKRIYQDQSFYANLYDKPENVQRTNVAMRAIELMLDREMYESRLRKEMMISVLLASKLEVNYQQVQSDLEALVGAD